MIRRNTKINIIVLFLYLNQARSRKLPVLRRPDPWIPQL